MIQSYVLLGTLGVHSIEDIRQKKITVTITLFSGILGILMHLVFQNQSIFTMLTGVFSGSLILLFSYLSKGKIGMGDGIVLMLTGLYLGLKENILLMLISFLAAGAWGLFLVTVRHTKKSERIPFVPFLFLGYGLMMIL